ncbi:hypothetical protein SELMODRAFT_431635 [Selaginella moellendorffii]|uniref:Uncharacterized protein n=1 Tax=Selaginella moellendorffii TaxID=88036 RepID=D8TDA5_SELML|nr:hypothetical protein SELMODRAFT_431635 [Selaginella moellendorffii]
MAAKPFHRVRSALNRRWWGGYMSVGAPAATAATAAEDADGAVPRQSVRIPRDRGAVEVAGFEPRSLRLPGTHQLACWGGGEGGDGSFTRLDSLAASQLSLPQRSVQDGRVSVHFLLATDRLLQLHYQDHMQEISMARLLKDMDCLGEHVCRKVKSPYLTMIICLCYSIASETRCLEAAHVLDGTLGRPGHPQAAAVRCGRGTVQRAGRSSLHVHVQALQHQATALEAGLVFVARDRITGKPARVNALEARRVDVDDRHDHHAALGAPQAADGWQKRVGCMLDEGRQLLASGSKDDASAVLIQSTRHQTCFMVEPQQLNSQGSVFGGRALG